MFIVQSKNKGRKSDCNPPEVEMSDGLGWSGPIEGLDSLHCGAVVTQRILDIQVETAGAGVECLLRLSLHVNKTVTVFDLKSYIIQGHEQNI